MTKPKLAPSDIYPLIGDSNISYYSDVLHRMSNRTFFKVYGFVVFASSITVSIWAFVFDIGKKNLIYSVVSKMIMVIIAELLIWLFMIGKEYFVNTGLAMIVFGSEAVIVCMDPILRKYNFFSSKIGLCVTILLYFIMNSYLLHDLWIIHALVTVIGFAAVFLVSFAGNRFGL